ncbi:MAG: hypothetical protein AAF587_02530 [Bacteroidota bacterium]
MTQPDPGISQVFGCSQHHRLLPQLGSDYILLDERNKGQLLGFGSRLAELINYFDENNELDGSFDAFFKADISLILSFISATNLQEEFEAYLQTIRFLQIQPASIPGKLLSSIQPDETELVFEELMQILYKQVSRCNEWLDFLLRADEGFELSAEVRGLLMTKLGVYYAFFTHDFSNEILILGKALSDQEQGIFYGVLHELLTTYDLLPDLQALIPQVKQQNFDAPPNTDSKTRPIGSLPKLSVSEQIHFVLPLIQTFVQGFFEAEEHILNRVNSLLQESLTSTHNHRPQAALYLAFIELFQQAQSSLNELTAKHLEFYYRDILAQQERARIPQHAIVLAELSPKTNFHPLPKGTRFLAGKDSQGAPIFFQSLEDILINRIQLAETSTLFISKGFLSNNSTVPVINNLYIAPKANSRDGQGKAFPPTGPKTWPTFGEEQIGRTETERSMIQADMGFAISSPMLLLASGKRVLQLELSLEGLTQPYPVPTDPFLVYLSGKKAWIQPESPALSVQAMLDKQGILTGFDIEIQLEAKDAPVVPYNHKKLKDPAPLYSEQWPVIRLVLDHRLQPHPYTYLRTAILSEVKIHTTVTNLTDLSLYTDVGKAAAQHPIPLFTGIPKLEANFFIGQEEAFSKPLDRITTSIQWKDLPADGFPTYYEVYNKDVHKEGQETPFPNNEVFQAKVSVLGNGQWNPVQTSSVSTGRINTDALQLFADQEGIVFSQGIYPRTVFPLWFNKHDPRFTSEEIAMIESLGNQFFLAQGDFAVEVNDLLIDNGSEALTQEKVQVLSSSSLVPTIQVSLSGELPIQDNVPLPLFVFNDSKRVIDVLNSLQGTQTVDFNIIRNKAYLTREAVLDEFSAPLLPPTQWTLIAAMEALLPNQDPKAEVSLYVFVLSPQKLDSVLDDLFLLLGILNIFALIAWAILRKKLENEINALKPLNGKLFLKKEHLFDAAKQQLNKHDLGDNLTKALKLMISTVKMPVNLTAFLFTSSTTQTPLTYFNAGALVNDKKFKAQQENSTLSSLSKLEEFLYASNNAFSESLSKNLPGLGKEARKRVLAALIPASMFTPMTQLYGWIPDRLADWMLAGLLGMADESGLGNLLGNQVYASDEAYMEKLEETSTGKNLTDDQRAILKDYLTNVKLPPKIKTDMVLYTFSELLQSAIKTSSFTLTTKGLVSLSSLSDGIYQKQELIDQIKKLLENETGLTQDFWDLLTGFFVATQGSATSQAKGPLLPQLQFTITDFTGMSADPFLPNPLTLQPGLATGYFRLQLSAPEAGFGEDLYQALLVKQLLTNASRISKSTDSSQSKPSSSSPHLAPLPNKPYVPIIQSIQIEYEAKETFVPGDGSNNTFYHISPFATYAEDGPQALLVENYSQQGYLHLGLSEVNPPEQLSLLVQLGKQLALSTRYPIPVISWEYLTDTGWEMIPDQSIEDQTMSFLRSGTIRILIPADISIQVGKTSPAAFKQMPSKTSSTLCWIRASLPAHADWVEPTLSIQTQAVELAWTSNSPAPPRPLPPKTIVKLAEADPAIKKISQPFSGFGGKLAEDSSGMNKRISERLRHKQRGIMGWDFERLVLEQFPDIFNVACLSHTTSLSADQQAPGNILLIVLPSIEHSVDFSSLPLKVDRAKLEEIKQFVEQYTSPFVKVEVSNPAFFRLKIKASLSLHSQAGNAYYLQLLTEALQQYFSPYVYQQQSLISLVPDLLRSDILSFILSQPYVSGVNLESVMISTDSPMPAGIPSTDLLDPFPEILQAAVPWGIFMSAEEHNFTITTS